MMTRFSLALIFTFIGFQTICYTTSASDSQIPNSASSISEHLESSVIAWSNHMVIDGTLAAAGAAALSTLGIIGLTRGTSLGTVVGTFSLFGGAAWGVGSWCAFRLRADALANQARYKSMPENNNEELRKKIDTGENLLKQLSNQSWGFRIAEGSLLLLGSTVLLIGPPAEKSFARITVISGLGLLGIYRMLFKSTPEDEYEQYIEKKKIRLSTLLVPGDNLKSVLIGLTVSF